MDSLGKNLKGGSVRERKVGRVGGMGRRRRIRGAPELGSVLTIGGDAAMGSQTRQHLCMCATRDGDPTSQKGVCSGLQKSAAALFRI